jgi:hypothetical protein
VGNCLFCRARVLGGDLAQARVGRIDRQLAKALVFFAVEVAVSDDTDPGVDLAWGRDPLGFVNEAIAGGLDHLLDLLLRGIGVKRGKL